MTDDAELLARLKAAADAAWAESHRLAHLADLGLVAPSEFHAALEKAQTATKRYQGIAVEGLGEEGSCQS